MTTNEAADLLVNALEHYHQQKALLEAFHRYGDSQALLAEFKEWHVPNGDDIELMLCPSF